MKRIATLILMLCLTVAASAQDAPKKYGIKSGIAKAKTTVMGQAVESTVYFDNYGAIEASKTKTSIPGAGEIEVSTISKDGKNYAVIPAMNQVQEQPAQESINYLNLTDEIVRKYKVKEVGKETVCGKECIKYTEEITQQGQTVASIRTLASDFTPDTFFFGKVSGIFHNTPRKRYYYFFGGDRPAFPACGILFFLEKNGRSGNFV